MLTLGQKTVLRKAIRPFGELYRSTRDGYAKLSEEAKAAKQKAVTDLEETMMTAFNNLKQFMDETEIRQWNDTIKLECVKKERQYDMFRDDDFGDGFRPTKKPDGATAYDERPVYPQEQKPVQAEAIGCFGKQIESAYAKQESLGLGE